MHRKKILVVDDSSTIRLLHQMALEELHYELLFAQDGQEAVDIALAEKPDLILMDVSMPRKSGLEACQELRGREETEKTPIFLVTIQDEPEQRAAGFQVGCTEYVTKPFNIAELLAKVRRYLGEG